MNSLSSGTLPKLLLARFVSRNRTSDLTNYTNCSGPANDACDFDSGLHDHFDEHFSDPFSTETVCAKAISIPVTRQFPPILCRSDCSRTATNQDWEFADRSITTGTHIAARITLEVSKWNTRSSITETTDRHAR